jgi:hypothetical protein
MNIEERILKLEEEKYKCPMPETAIQRIFPKEGPKKWCLALGMYYSPKLFFEGNTIEECITKAENYELLKEEKEYFLHQF